MDIDIVIREADMAALHSLLKTQGYQDGPARELHVLYGERFQRLERTVAGYPASVDVLVNGLVARATNASWSFPFLQEHSAIRAVEGIAFPVPERELLIATKIHSARLSDVRDIAALAPGADVDRVVTYARRGDRAAVGEVLRREIAFAEHRNFIDGFKGVFGAQAFAPALVPATVALLRGVLQALMKA